MRSDKRNIGYCQRTLDCRRAYRRGWMAWHAWKDRPAPTRCKNCGESLNSDNTTGYCRRTPECDRARGRVWDSRRADRHKNVPTSQAMWYSAKRRAAAKGIPFEITPSDIEAIMSDRCPIFRIDLQRGNGVGGAGEQSPTLDRIVNSKGYVPGNIQILSHKANSMKQDATPEELLMFADWIYATFGKVE
jgi:hypothetical protein